MQNTSLILFNSLTNDSYDTFIKKIFNYHSLINTTNEHGESLLHHCAYYGLIEQYYALINVGADIQKTKAGNTLLHYASLSGKDDFLVTELVKIGFSPLEKNIFGESSLHCCGNKRISHYFNMWCLRNKIKVDELLDEDLNSVAHGCKMHGNLDSCHYWVTNYPNLYDMKNIFNKTWKQSKRKKYTTSLY